MIELSCDPGYSLHGSTTSQCVSGEWTPSPDTVMCIADQAVITSTPSMSYKNVQILVFLILKSLLQFQTHVQKSVVNYVT